MYHKAQGNGRIKQGLLRNVRRSLDIRKHRVNDYLPDGVFLHLINLVGKPILLPEGHFLRTANGIVSRRGKSRLSRRPHLFVLA